MAEEGASELVGGEVNYSEYSDKEDLVTYYGKYSVKSRHLFKLPKSLKDYFIFIPVDQYDAALEECEWLIMMLVIGEFNIEQDKPLWKKLDIYCAGDIYMEEFDKKKKLYKAGTKINDYFGVPWPDSYGIRFDRLSTVS